MAATGEGTAKGRRRDGEERACDAEGEERMHRRGGRVGRKREGGGPRKRGFGLRSFVRTGETEQEDRGLAPGGVGCRGRRKQKRRRREDEEQRKLKEQEEERRRGGEEERS